MKVNEGTASPLAGRQAIAGSFASIVEDLDQQLSQSALEYIQGLQVKADQAQREELKREPLGGYLNG